MVTVVWAQGLVPGDGLPLHDGAVVLEADGTVLEVGPAAEILPRHQGAQVERVEGVLVPGLVNAHTHLELSALRGEVPGGRGFVPWVEGLIGARACASPGDTDRGVARAVVELDAAGTVAVGEVTNTLAAVGALVRGGFAGAVFHEVFGVERERSMARIAALAAEWKSAFGGLGDHELTYAPTPHTLYTTHPEALRALLDAGRRAGGLMSLHWAEHPGEREALENGTGPVVEWTTQRLKIPVAHQSWPRRPLMDVTAAAGALGEDVLLVHLTDAGRDELRRVADACAPVVLCPRSNQHIEGRLPPLGEMLEAGIAPALGTDSLASSPSLDVLGEARCLGSAFPTVGAHHLLAMATWNGARALRRPDLGRIARGARPGLLAFEGGEGARDPAARVLDPAAKRRWVVRRRSRGAR